jgi:hypothetical protein
MAVRKAYLVCRLTEVERQLVENTCWYYGISKAGLFARIIWHRMQLSSLLSSTKREGEITYEYKTPITSSTHNAWIQFCMENRRKTKAKIVHDSSFQLRQSIRSIPTHLHTKVMKDSSWQQIEVLEFLPPAPDDWGKIKPTTTPTNADYN